MEKTIITIVGGVLGGLLFILIVLAVKGIEALWHAYWKNGGLTGEEVRECQETLKKSIRWSRECAEQIAEERASKSIKCDSDIEYRERS